MSKQEAKFILRRESLDPTKYIDYTAFHWTFSYHNLK